MERFLFTIIIVCSSLLAKGQVNIDSIKIEALIIITNQETGMPASYAEIMLYTPDKGALKFKSDSLGQILLTNQLPDTTIRINQIYDIIIVDQSYLNNEPMIIDPDRFSTEATQNTRIIREVYILVPGIIEEELILPEVEDSINKSPSKQ